MAIHRYAARVVVLDPAERVLLLNWANRKKGTNWWATPGGGMEEGEKARVAAIRELAEEAGIEVADMEGPLWRSSHFFRSGADLVLQHEVFFMARVVADAVSMEGLDQFEAATSLGHRWWPLDELEASGEAIYPKGLADLVRDVLRLGVPAKALVIKG